MSQYGYTRQIVINGNSANSSTVTEGPVLTADWNTVAISILTNAAVASNHTFQGSNDDGSQSAIAANSWSNLSVVAAQGQVKFDSGNRWIRVLKPSVDSLTTYIFEGRVY